jgi:hypothetical protein
MRPASDATRDAQSDVLYLQTTTMQVQRQRQLLVRSQIDWRGLDSSRARALVLEMSYHYFNKYLNEKGRRKRKPHQASLVGCVLLVENLSSQTD